VSTTLKVGVIGVGGIAKTHMPGWAASDIAEVVAGSDVFEPALAAWGATHSVAKLSTDAEEIINDPDIDIIDICTPNMYHAPLAIAALEAGKHVICEKPLAPKPADIRKMIAARDASGKTLMTAQHFRFKGSSKALKAEIDSGSLGDIYHARSLMLRRGWIPARPGFIYKKNSGGGPTIDTQLGERLPGVARHRRDEVGDLVSDPLERGPGEVGVGGPACEAEDRAARVGIPIRGPQPGQGRDEVHAVAVRDGRRQGLDRGGGADQFQPVAQPLDRGPADEDAALQGVRRHAGLLPGDGGEQLVF